MSDTDAPYTTPAGEPASTPRHDAGGQPVPVRADGASPSRRSGLAIAALVVGILSILLCLIPVVNIVSIVGGIAALVLGIVALRKLVPGVNGKGMAVAGIVLGALSAVVAVVVSVVLGLAIGDAIESGELDQVIEDAAAQEEAGAGDEAVADPPQAPAATEPATDPAGVPVEVAREDFSDLDCAVLGDEAVFMSQEEDTGVPALIKVRESVVVEDHRTDYATPTGVEESLVLSCRGTAAWDDTTQSSVLTELTIDADGELFIAYAAE